MTQTIPVQGPFSLAASVGFLEGFGGAMSSATARTPEGAARLRLAFPVEGDWRTAGASVRQDKDIVLAEIFGEVDSGSVTRQLRRILSLDVDGRGYLAVGRRDPVIGRLQHEFHGLRPVCFWSAYEAAAWAVIGQRISMRQAARIKGDMATALGQCLEVDGAAIDAFPAPAVLSTLTAFPGLTERKIGYLRNLGAAAAAGSLDSDRLRDLPRGEALSELQALPGIGPFSAELVLLRGAGDPDAVPTQERRLLAALAAAYDVPATAEALAEVAEGWRPYRTWACVLLRAAWAS